MAAAASPASVLLLYRRILKAGKLFPSIKRDAILQDIRREFREHKVRHFLAAMRAATSMPSAAGAAHIVRFNPTHDRWGWCVNSS
jgi:hypothetical protein